MVVNPGQVPGSDCLAASCALVIANADTALTSAANGGYPQLSDNGVPFGFIDREPKNNFRYFYSVTAFDINSYQSGPSSLESPRVAKPVTPSVTGSNVAGSRSCSPVCSATALIRSTRSALRHRRGDRQVQWHAAGDQRCARCLCSADPGAPAALNLTARSTRSTMRAR